MASSTGPNQTEPEGRGRQSAFAIREGPRASIPGQERRDPPPYNHQFGEDKSQSVHIRRDRRSGQGKQDELAGVKGDPQQQADKTQRQQGDEDLGDDSIDNQSLK